MTTSLGMIIYLQLPYRRSSNLSCYSKDLTDERGLSHDIHFLALLNVNMNLFSTILNAPKVSQVWMILS